MKKLHYLLSSLIVLSILFSSCKKEEVSYEECPRGYSGSDCSNPLPPTSITIKKIVVMNYDSLKSSMTWNPTPWDPASNPDPVISIGYNQSLHAQNFKTTPIVDAQKPITITMPNNHTIYNLSSYIYIYMYEHDLLLTPNSNSPSNHYDFMGEVSLIPALYSTGLPTTINLHDTHSNYEINLHVQWNF